MTPLPSLTAVCVVADGGLAGDGLERLSAFLADQAAGSDIVLVANGVGPDTALHLKAAVDAVPDVTCVFLAQEGHDDLARLVGIEHAVGDYVLFCDCAEPETGALAAILAPLAKGYDLVLGQRTGPGVSGSRRSAAALLLSRVYTAVYAAVTGTDLEFQPTGLRVLSRAAALFVCGRPDAEFLLRARAIGSGFPSTVIELPPVGAGAIAGRRVRHGWTKGVGLLLSVSALPLRTASYAALGGGAFGVLYSLYVSAVYFFKPDVASGWTTISLQLAAMTFGFSVVLLFISEYIIQIHSTGAIRSRQHLVQREIRSKLSRRANRLNVVDPAGTYQLGRPAWLAHGPD